MIRTVIDKIEGYRYFLKDKDNNDYILNIEFYDLDKIPQAGDYLFLSGETLNEPNSVLNFGLLSSPYGRNIESENNPDFCVLVISGEKYFLKRLYG